ncbi:MAG: rhamnulokinase [Clostridiales bacterium]|nr:rhamnulokinase [Clostridiales bacterium]
MGKKLLTFDFGASSGRGILADFDGSRLDFREIHRFVNDPVHAFGHYYWDILRLFGEIKTGIGNLYREGVKDVASMGVDTWGVDFALLDEYDKPLSNPFYYRDSLTDGAMERVYSVIPKAELYDRTGIQFMKFNTIFQLEAIRHRYPKLLERAKTMLLMPDMLNYMLTGVKTAELSMASTTQLMDVRTRSWDREIFDRLGIPTDMLVPITDPGRVIGNTSAQILDETRMSIPVVSVCGHDTGSAVIAVPMKPGESCAYISCGTWSLLGVELSEPNTTDRAFAVEYTNEAGFGRTIRFLKNIMGLWIYQEIKRELEHEFGKIDYATLDAEIEAARPLAAFIDPDAGDFFEKGHMIEKVRNYCRVTGQTVPEKRGEILRCVLESLAMKYRYATEQLEKILDKPIDTIRVVGGGCKDKLLMKFTAKASARPVMAGPVEATAVGNTCAQLIAIGEIENIWQARQLVSDSCDVKEYSPDNRDGWEDAYGRFLDIIDKGE